jgi:hypothetical protein
MFLESWRSKKTKVLEGWRSKKTKCFRRLEDLENPMF